MSFPDRAAALETLDAVRVLLAQGRTFRQALAAFAPSRCPEDYVKRRIEQHIDYWRDLVERGQRSPTSLRELERYAKPGGHFSFWDDDQRAPDLTVGDIEDFHAWLGRRGIGPKTQRNVSDAFRAVLRRLLRRGDLDSVPAFPTIEVPDYAPRIIETDVQARILEAIPWERRGGVPSGSHRGTATE